MSKGKHHLLQKRQNRFLSHNFIAQIELDLEKCIFTFSGSFLLLQSGLKPRKIECYF